MYLKQQKGAGWFARDHRFTEEKEDVLRIMLTLSGSKVLGEGPLRHGGPWLSTILCSACNPNVVEYRQNVFLPRFFEFLSRKTLKKTE